jgi:hypothetical protein
VVDTGSAAADPARTGPAAAATEVPGRTIMVLRARAAE